MLTVMTMMRIEAAITFPFAAKKGTGMRALGSEKSEIS